MRSGLQKKDEQMSKAGLQTDKAFQAPNVNMLSVVNKSRHLKKKILSSQSKKMSFKGS